MSNEARINAELDAVTPDEILPKPIHPSKTRVPGIYFARVGDWVKIGAADNVARRIRELQTACPLTIRVLAIVPGGLAEERTLHKRMKAHRERGEWFRLCPEVIALIWNAAKSVRHG